MKVDTTNSTTCVQVTVDYHPCLYPYTTLATAWSDIVHNTDPSNKERFDCSITFARSSGRVHGISCVVHVILSLLLGCTFVGFFLNAHIKTGRRRGPPRPPAQRSISTGILFGAKFTVVEEFYLAAALGLFVNSVCSIDLMAQAGRLSWVTVSAIIEVIVNLGITMTSIVVVAWAKTFYVFDKETKRKMSILMIASLFVTWVVSLSVEIWGQGGRDYGSNLAGTYDGTINSLKHIVVGIVQICYGTLSVVLACKLMSRLDRGSRMAQSKKPNRTPDALPRSATGSTSRSTFLGMGMGGISMAKMSGVGGSRAMSRSTTLSADGSPRQTKEQRRITREQAKVKRTIGAFAIWIAVYNVFCVVYRAYTISINWGNMVSEGHGCG
mmetsp:Transcript_890/g.1682  ORF Transcript_890/g.1682 Transcript_890/m.1682 type:complete len:382 (-) Transcript_890:31-1176(-)